MGDLFYGNGSKSIAIPDTLLAHVKVVVSTKLRRNEAFTLSWRHSGADVPGRTTLWIQPSIPLRFVFESPEPEVLNSALLKDMAQQANSSSGLTIDLDAAGAAGPAAAAGPAKAATAPRPGGGYADSAA
ncbi:hypothetical protein [Microbacterium sp. cx-59]|uniref:DUF7882 family protein n=1 Tax=Microbacterium sp. cx-59 TaxID=2891207 RepID=UPI001E432CA0|nr:hypothetical protein [Microbacterium sp. cx-59]MCC4908059.1 hypothetical protein [Microbacterium sp. cx-59]